jgi:hypothetical protein
VAKHKDKIKGGLADKKQPKDFDKDLLDQGVKIELEHSSDPSIAQEIAMDHLSEDKDYYKKLSEMEKQDKLKVVSTDGKSDIVEGRELLEKDPVKNKWQKVKKSLNNLEAIMNLKEEAQLEDKDQAEPEQQMQPEPQQDQSPAEEPAQEEIQPNIEIPEPTQSEQAEEPVDEQKELEALMESLKHHGYSDAEIAHIVHDHHFPETSDKEAADISMSQSSHDLGMDMKQQSGEHDLEHKKRMLDLEYKQAQASAEDPMLDKEHKRRMLELEYEIAREQKILELEFKKRELELKLKHMEDSNKKKLDGSKHE